MHTLNTTKKILDKKSATISLSELAQLCHVPDYSAFVAQINGFIADGILRPMGKDTNGMFPPLYSRYRIIRADPDTTVKDEILRLGPDFNPSGYLSNTPLYMKHRKLLRSLLEYIRTDGAELELSMSKNERAYAIWSNEKQLDSAVCRSMLRFIGWEGKLNYYHTPEPFLDYLCHGANTTSILILENKDIWFSLRKLFMENNTACTLFGEYFDGLLYGEGKKIARRGALADYSLEGFSAPPAFSYWGDLDYEGIAIYLNISQFPVKLFAPGYLAMLGYGRSRVLTTCRADQIMPPGIDEFWKNFDRASVLDMLRILQTDKYIPQEICSYPRLKAALNAAL